MAVTTAVDPASGEAKPLFAFPVSIAKATTIDEAKFDIAAPSGAERKQVYIDTATGEIVEDDDCPRGVRVGDTFRVVPKEAIDAVNGTGKDPMIVVKGRVALADVDFTRAEGTYFVQTPAKGGSAKAYRLLYEALREERKGKKVVVPAQALVAKRTVRTKQKLVVIYADEQVGALMLVQLRFGADLKAPDEQILAPQHAQVEQAQIDTARKVILTAVADGRDLFDTEVDEAVARKRALVEQALEGEAIAAPTPVAATKVEDDIEAQLVASLA